MKQKKKRKTGKEFGKPEQCKRNSEQSGSKKGEIRIFNHPDVGIGTRSDCLRNVRNFHVLFVAAIQCMIISVKPNIASFRNGWMRK